MLGGRSLRDRRAWLIVGALAVGLAIRVLFVSRHGTGDVDTYIQWGYDTVNLGLAKAYHGIYFPLQYDLFSLAVRGANSLGVSSLTALKLGTLVFDAGSLGLLALLLRRCGASPAYALIYWLHPFFLWVYILGYIDSQMGFFVVLALVGLSYARAWWQYVVASIPLGAAFLLKPQAELLVIALAGLGVLSAVGGRIRRLRVGDGLRSPGARYLLLLVGPVALFALFSAVLATDGHSLTYLAQTYSPGELARQSNSLSANMPNVWFVVADALAGPGEPLYAVTSPAILHTIGFLLAAPLVLVAALLIARLPRLTTIQSTVAVLAVATLVTPMVLTRGHENHLFLGGLLGVVLVALVRRRWFTIAFSGLLAVQFVNLLGRYGFGLNSWTQHDPVKSFSRHYLGTWALVDALLGCVLFVICLWQVVVWALSAAGPRADTAH